jgi:preprotein translocase subunit SecE
MDDPDDTVSWNVRQTLTEQPMAATLANNRVVKYLKEVRAEMRKVTWPSRAEIVRLSTIVITVLVAASAFMALVDYVFAWLMRIIVNPGTNL